MVSLFRCGTYNQRLKRDRAATPISVRNGEKGELRRMKALLRLFREIYEYFWLYFGLIYFGIAGITGTVVSAMLYPLLSRKTGMWLGRWIIGMIFRSYLAILRASGVLKLDLTALDKLGKDKGLIIAANHPSILDAVLIISRVPDIACIMKAEIWDSVILGGGLARLARYIRNDSPRNMIRRSTEELQSGQRLLVFPEGTRTRRKPINAFKGGFALIAKKSAAPLQTVFIESNSSFLSKGWPILKKPRMPLVYRIRLGKRFQCSGDTRTFITELERYYRQTLGPEPVIRASIPDTERLPGEATNTH
jgi:1-acyl-sn-glycerol-3-phosphate acyltransferase